MASHAAKQQVLWECVSIGQMVNTLPTPSRLSERYLYLFVTWDEKQMAHRRRTQHERSHIGTDDVVLRGRRSRLGGARIP